MIDARNLMGKYSSLASCILIMYILLESIERKIFDGLLACYQVRQYFPIKKLCCVFYLCPTVPTHTLVMTTYITIGNNSRHGHAD